MGADASEIEIIFAEELNFGNCRITFGYIYVLIVPF